MLKFIMVIFQLLFEENMSLLFFIDGESKLGLLHPLLTTNGCYQCSTQNVTSLILLFSSFKADPAIRIDTLPLCAFHFCLAKRANTFSFPFAIDSVTLNCVFVFDHKICLSVK